MKNISVLLLALLFFAGCSGDEDPIGDKSVLDTSPPLLNETDRYIRETFTDPYNIDVLYKFDQNITDVNRFLTPPKIENVRPALDLIKRAWIDTYNEVGGEDFVKEIAPREFALIGSLNYNQSGTITLGLAEAGARITLFNIDSLNLSGLEAIRDPFQPLRTIHHEYGHILNQNVPIPPAYKLVNPQYYTAQWFNRKDKEARGLGYITAYASSSPEEDFAEMIATMLIHSKEEFNALVNGISVENDNPVSKATAQKNIRRKEAMVVEYFKEYFNIDFYELQEVSISNIESLVNDYKTDK